MARAPLWPPEADAWLKAMPLSTPLAVATQIYNHKARERGWPPRTQRALEQRWRKLMPNQRSCAKRKAVMCAATKQVWPSIAAAAREFDRSEVTVGEALKAQGRWGSLVLCDQEATP